MRDDVSVLDHLPALRDVVSRRTARDVVADKIARLIVSGVLQVGDQLPSERDLAAALHVSRETVRGGIQSLAARGVIEVSQGTRTRVAAADLGSSKAGLYETRKINSYDIETIHAARKTVERPVVSAAAEHITGQEMALLRDLLAAQRAAGDDPVRFLISDREFHLTIYRASRNPALADFVSDLYTYMMAYRRKAVARPGAIAASCRDHEAIVAGLAAHDAPSVVAAFDIHLDRIYATTRGIIDADRTPPIRAG
ncbi:MAG: FadR family transcriptional regulator [Proteobacteria bacterium]|nr:FadR family transcriptional regulator [Pseudomonadota bacterium]